MIVKRVFPANFEELKGLVSEASSGAKSIAVQAGHFLVYYDHTEDQLLPCVASELNGPRHEIISSEVGQFPLLTWEIGIDLLRGFPSNIKKQILIVANDWQYLPKGIDRFRFYSRYPSIFGAYQELLNSEPEISLITPKSLGMGKETNQFFSEVSLRNQYNRNVLKYVDSPESRDRIESKIGKEGLECSLIDVLGRQQQIYCAGKEASCTHEIAELTRQIVSLGENDVFINLYPIVCKEYVEAGIELSIELKAVENQTVISVGMVSSGVSNRNELFKASNYAQHQASDVFA